MNPAYGVYAAVSSALFVSALPFYYLYSKLAGTDFPPLSQRLGVYGAHATLLSGSPRIWIHAVSVGEVNVASAVIQALREKAPHCGIILSTTTPHGQAAAREKLGDQSVCVFAPFDFIPSVQHALATFRPELLVCLETEIWPNWLMVAHRMGIRTALINGRVSVRSIKKYLKIRPLMQATFSQMDAFSMIHTADARRIRMLGACPQKVTVGGNAKYDLLIAAKDASIPRKMAKIYNVAPDQPVWVAGSIRGTEGNVVLAVFKKILARFPNAVLIVAPRHLKRVPEIRSRAHSLGLSTQLRTQLNDAGKPRAASVVIIDTMGELPATYSIATLVFCGGSLVPLGGQNVLEAAVWEKPVFYGPSMDDFSEAKVLLEKWGGGFEVADGSALETALLRYFSNPNVAAAAGRRAGQAVFSRESAARRHAAVIHRLLGVPQCCKSPSPKALGVKP